MKNILIVFFCTLALTAGTQNPGTLDLNFGTNGLSATDRFTFESIAAVAPLPDGNIMAAGFTLEDDITQLVVLRYLPNGALDPTFAQNGAYIGLIGQRTNVATSMAIQPDGKILVAGYTVKDGLVSYQPKNMFVMRLHPNGTLDNTFGTGGVVTLDYGKNEEAVAIKLHPNGNIIVAGNTFFDVTSSFLVYSLHADGSLDNSFGVAGAQKLSFNQSGTGWSHCYNMAISNAGKICLAGEVYVALNGTSFGLMRLLPNGELDNTFSADGKTTNSIGQFDDVAYTIAVLPNEKMILGGYSVGQSGKTSFAMIKYNANGSLDNSFGEFGKSVTAAGDGYGAIMDLCVASSGSILAAGNAKRNGSTYDFALAKFQSDGKIDPAFGNQGFVYTDFNRHYDGLNDAHILPDGKVLLAGTGVNPANSINEFLLARYWYGESTGTGSVEHILVSTLAYPNPTDGSALHLEYTLKTTATVEVGLYALDGRLMTTLESGFINAGRQESVYNLPPDLPAGNYLLSIQADGHKASLQITVQH